MFLGTTLTIFSATNATWGERSESLITGAPLGRNVVRVINITEAISIPFTVPNPAPQIRSTQPKNAMLSI